MRASGRTPPKADQLGPPNGGNVVYAGDPVNTATGNVWYSQTDLQLPGRGLPFVLTRTYNSQSDSEGLFGHGWLATYDTRVVGVSSGDDEHTVEVLEPGGAIIAYGCINRDTAGECTSWRAPRRDGKLSRLGSGYRLKARTGEVFDYGSLSGSEGRIQRFADRHGNQILVDWDQANQVVFTDSAGRTITAQLDSSERITSLTDPASRSISYTYDSNNLASVTDQTGAVTTYTYGDRDGAADSDGDDPHNLIAINQPRLVSSETNSAARSVFRYDSQDRAVESWRQDPSLSSPTPAQKIGRVHMEYRTLPSDENEDPGWEPPCSPAPCTLVTNTAVSAERSELSRFHFDQHGQTTKLSRDNGLSGTERRVDTKLYEFTDGRMSASVDPAGNRTEYEYDTDGNLTRSLSPKPSSLAGPEEQPETTMSGYDQYGNPSVIRAWDAAHSAGMTERALYRWYDNQGNLSEERDAYSNGLVSPPTAPSAPTATERRTTYSYDTHGQLTESTDPEGVTSTWQYDAQGNLTRYQRVKPAANATAAEIRAESVLMSYDSIGRLTQSCDQLERCTDYEYDPRDRPTKTTLPAPSLGGSRPVTQAAYDSHGNLKWSEDALNHRTNHAYDIFDRRISSTDPTGRTTSWAYDAESKLVSEIAPDHTTANPRITTFTYDNFGRLIKTVTPDGGSGDVSTSAYNSLNQLTSITDPRGNTTRYEYDDLGRLRRVKDALNTSGSDSAHDSLYSYDVFGNLVQARNPNGKLWDFTYTRLNQLKSKSLPKPSPSSPERVTNLTYDKRGNLAEQTDPKGQLSKRTYDQRARLTRVEYPSSSTPDEVFTYDSADQLSASNTRNPTTQAVINSNTFTRDRLGRPTGELVQPRNVSITRAFDLASRQTSLTLPGYGSQSFTYDNADRLASLKDASNRITTYTYDPAGRLAEQKLPGEAGRSAYSYTPVGQLKQVEHYGGATLPGGVLGGIGGVGESLRSKRAYTYDDAGNTVGVTDEAGVLDEFSYDPLNRLIQEIQRGNQPGTTDYSYDRGGNRLSKTRGSSVTNYTYDGAEQMTGAGSESFTYDLNGQTLSRSGVTGGAPARNYTWDAAGRMSGDGTQSFTYDANGQRVRITAGSTVTDRLFDGGEVVQELTGSALSTTVRDGGLHSLQTGTAGATANYYRTDVNESVLALTSPTGAVARSYDYSAFGDLLGSTGTAPPNPLTLLGQQEQDPAAKTHNFNARSYDAGHGRFLSQDPIAGSLTAPQTLNPYGYGWNNPWGSPDPSGLWPSLPSWHDLGNGLLSGAELIPIAGAGVSAMRYSVEHWDDKGGMPWGGLAKDIGLNLAMSVTPVGVVGKVGGKAGKGELVKLAEKVRNAGDRQAKNMRTIAVGESKDGVRYVGSSNRLDKGQKEKASQLGLRAVKDRKGKHAEEDLMDQVPELKRVGSNKRAPCGPDEHNCRRQLQDRGIEIDNDYVR